MIAKTITIDAEADRDPWDRLSGEPALWYDRFVRYRDMGSCRAVVAVYRAEKGLQGVDRQSPGRWRTEAAKWRWTERAERWDAEQRRSQQAERHALIEAAQERYLQTFLLQQEKALEALRALDPKTLTPDQALRLMQSGIDGERQCLEGPVVEELQRQVDELIRIREEGARCI